ncbi:MAG: M48 family metalloprotease [Alphaproteobacteria bacterium]
MKEKKWNFSPFSDGVATTTTTAIGCAVLGIGLSYFFTPVALAAATGYGLYHVARDALYTLPKVRDHYFKQQVEKGHYTPLDPDAPVVKMSAEISNALGRKEPPKFYTVDEKIVAQMSLPWGLRWMIKIPSVRDSAMSDTFAALPGTNTLITTQVALNRPRTADELKFIMAHEMSHLHANDNLSPAILGRTMVKKVTRALFWGTAAALGLGIFGVGVPVIAGTSAALALGGLWGTSTAAKVCFNLAMRTIENRADRNAMYITRDYQAGEDALASIDSDSYRPKPLPFYREMLLDHPSYHPRIKTLKESFNKASQYPEIMPKTVAPATPANNAMPGLRFDDAAMIRILRKAGF